MGGEGWRTRLGVLRHPSFALLWSAGVISSVGDWALVIGLTYFVYALTGSTLATAGLFLAALVPQLLIGSVAGVFVDRWSRRRTMIVANFVLAAGLLPLLAVHSSRQAWIVFAVAVFESGAAAFVSPAEGALIPALVGEEALLQANSVYGAGRQLSRLVGAAVGGVLVGEFGLVAIAAVDASSFFVAAILIIYVMEPGRAIATAASVLAHRFRSLLGTVRREWADGLRVTLRSRQALVMLLFVAVTGLGEGVFGTLMAPFVVRVLHGSGADYGWFNALQAVGGIIGGIYVATRARAWDPVKVLPVSAGIFGGLDLVLFTYPLFLAGIGFAFILIVLVGLPASAVGASFTSLQQSAVHDRLRGRYLGLAQSVTLLTATVGSLLAGFLGSAVGIIAILEIQGAVYVVAGILVALARLPGADRERGNSSPSKANPALPASP